MAQSDVELVIKGVDQASDVFKEVAKSTSTLSKQLDEASKEAGKSDPKIQQLRDSFKGLKDSLAGLAQTNDVINDFKKAQDAAASASAKVEKLSTEFDQLVAASKAASDALTAANEAYNNNAEDIAKLEASIKQLGAAKNQIANDDELNIERLEKQKALYDQQIAKQQQLTAETEKATQVKKDSTQAIGTITAEMEQSTAAIDRQKSSLSALKAEESFLTQQIKTTASELSKSKKAFADLSTAITNTANKIGESGGKIDSLGNEFTDLGQKITAARQDQDAAKQSMTTLETAVTGTTTKLKELRDAFGNVRTDDQKRQVAELALKQKELNGALSAAKKEYKEKTAAVDALVSKQEKVAQGLDKEKTKLAELNSERKEQQQALDRNIQQQDVLGASLNRLNTLLKSSRLEYSQQSTSLAEMVANHEKLKASLKEAEGLVEKSSSELKKLSKSYDENAVKIELTEQRLAELTVELEKYGNSLSDLDGAEAKRVAALAKITAEIDRNKQALVEQKAANADIKASITSLTQEKEKYAKQVAKNQIEETKAKAAVQAAAAALKTKEAAVTNLGADVSKLSAHETHLAAEVARVSAQMRGAVQAASQLAGEKKKVATATATAAEEQRKYGESQRTALSLTQRVRGQLLSLAAAYIGVFEAINLVSQSLQEYVNQQAAVAQITSILGDNTEAVGRQFEYVKKVADELKMPLDVLRTNYAKLFTSMQQQGQSTEEIRRLFEGVSTAARVMNLSVDDVEGTFRALTQIFGKGKVTAEELTQQLGDRFPAAVPLMAKALGVGTGELFKMMEAGDVAADKMLLWADVIKNEYSGGLEIALNSWQALNTELRNSSLTIKKEFGEKLAKELTEPFKRLNEALKNGQFSEALDNIAKALGSLASVVVYATENLDALLSVLKGFAYIKLAQVVVGWRAELLNLGKGAGVATGAMTALATAMKGILPVLAITVALYGFEYAVKGIDLLMQKLSGYEEAQRKLKKAEEEHHNALKRTYDQQQKNLDAMREYKDVQVLSAREIANLSDEELVLYKQRLEKNKEYNELLLRNQKLGKQIGLDIKDQAEEAEAALGDVAVAFERIKNAQELLANGVNPLEMIGAGAEELIEKFDKVLSSSGDVKKGIEEIIKEAGSLERVNLVAFGEALDELAQKGVITAEEMRFAWDEALKKLGTDSFNTFALRAKQTFEGTERDARILGEALDASIRVQLDTLGVKFEDVFQGKVGKATQDAIKHIHGLDAAMELAGTNGEVRFAALEAAIGKAVNNAENMAALDALQGHIRGLATVGSLSKESMERLTSAIDAQKRKIEESIPGYQSLREAENDLYTAKIASAKASAELQTALGNESAAGRALAEVKRLENEQAIKSAEAKQIEAAAALRAAEATLVLVQSDKQATAEKIATAQAAVEVARANLEAANATLQLVKAKALLTGDVKLLNEAKKALGETTEELTDKVDKLGNEVEKTDKKVRSYTTTWEQLGKQYGIATENAKMFGEIASAAIRAVNSQPYMSVYSYINRINNAYRSAADSAKAFAAQQSALNAKLKGSSGEVANLEMRLLELTGTEEEIAKARAARERADIQLKLEQAQLDARMAASKQDKQKADEAAEQIKSLTRQLGLIDQIHTVEAQRRRDANQQRQREANDRLSSDLNDTGEQAGLPTTTRTSSALQSAPTPIKTVRIELPTATGKTSIDVMPGQESIFQDWLTGVLRGRSTA